MVKKRDKSYEYPQQDSSNEEEHLAEVHRPEKIRNDLQLKDWLQKHNVSQKELKKRFQERDLPKKVISFLRARKLDREAKIVQQEIQDNQTKIAQLKKEEDILKIQKQINETQHQLNQISTRHQERLDQIRWLRPYKNTVFYESLPEIRSYSGLKKQVEYLKHLVWHWINKKQPALIKAIAPHIRFEQASAETQQQQYQND